MALTEPEAAPAERRRTYGVPLRRGPVLRLPAADDVPKLSEHEAVRRWVKAQRGPTAIDLFSGAGGLSLGLSDAGFSVIVAADSDEVAVETHVANLGGLGYAGSLADPTEFLARLKDWGVTEADLLAAGVPCQPFSSAGKSKIRSLVKSSARPPVDPRAELWRSFVKIVEVLRPRAVLVENVPGLAEWNEGAVLVGLQEGCATWDM